MHLNQFSGFRPNNSVREDPRAWWKYAINAVISQVIYIIIIIIIVVFVFAIDKSSLFKKKLYLSIYTYMTPH